MTTEFASPLTWSRVDGSKPPEFVLKSNTNTLGRLVWQKSDGSRALGHTPQGDWTFEHSGFLATRITVRNAASDQEQAIFYPFFCGGGRIEMVDGRSWQLRPRGLLGSRHELQSETSRVVLTMKLGGWGKSAEVQFESPLPDDRTAALLALLVWYVHRLESEETNAAVLIACIS